MTEVIHQLSYGIERIFNASSYVYKYKMESLKDLLYFGSLKFPAEKVTFRWPTVEYLKMLNFNEPLKLQAVRTKASQSNFLSAIQLVYQNGIESPLFDACRDPQAEEITTINVPDSRILSIDVMAGNSNIREIKFELTNGQKLAVF